MTIVTIASSKGGSGKTSTAVSLASALANLDGTFIVDADAQGQVTFSFGLPVASGLHDWIMTGKPYRDCLIPGRPIGLQILPGDSHSWAIEREHGTPAAFARLVDRLRGLANMPSGW